ncbi:MAG: acyltransferase family protein [Candidatus Acidiferrales bacterium]
MTFTQISGRKQYLPELDGLRAIAVLLVITAHMQSAIFNRLVGRLGVTIFFVLSGYLITFLSLGEEFENGSLGFCGFYIRRIFRICPLYYFVLGLYCFLILGLHISPDKQLRLVVALPYYIFYFQEIPFLGMDAGQTLPFYQSWSLGIEEKFYLLWPALCFLILRHKTRFRIPVAIVLMGTMSFSRYTRPYISILFGCVLALCFEFPFLKKSVQRVAGVGSWVSLCLLVAFQVIVMPGWKWAYAGLVYSAAFCIFLALLLTSENIIKRVLATRQLVFFGKMSYGIYLIHVLCISALPNKLHFQNPVGGFLIVCSISLAIATAMHYMIEKPFINFGRSLSQKFETTGGATSLQSKNLTANGLPVAVTPVPVPSVQASVSQV